MAKLSRFVGLFGFFLLFSLATQAQDITELISMSVNAGYDTYFREEHWLPVRIQVANNGEDVTGRLIVRPETSGRVVSNAYSVPIDLPTGSEKAVFLYIQARTFPPTIRVELLNENSDVVANEEANLTPLASRDLMYIVVSGANANPIPFGEVALGGFNAFQADWGIEDFPDHVLAIDAVNVIVLNSIDSGAFSNAQRTALTDWVTQGGHLIVIGGPNWQATASGLDDILPLRPDGIDTLDEVTGYAQFAGDLQIDLEERTVIATGDLADDAFVLAGSEDVPLIARRWHGAGTVDYVSADPTLQPLRDWERLPEMWSHLVSSVRPQPVWTAGVKNFDWAHSSLSILPGVNLLPSVWSLCLFLFGYIVVIGPVNYFILSRLNRREWAWITIPLSIILFSVIAWTVGFNLRGNDIIVSRLTVVQSWEDSERAHVQQLVGLLSPRRSDYAVEMPEGRWVNILQPGATTQGLFGTTNVQSSMEIREGSQFRADSFTIDGGIFANFNTQDVIDSPDIGGSLTMLHTVSGTHAFQGSIRNDSEITLEDAVILVDGASYELNSDLEPGDIITISPRNLTADVRDTAPSPLPFEYIFGFDPGFRISDTGGFRIVVGGRSQTPFTVSQIMGEDYLNATEYRSAPEELDETRRRQAFLQAFALEQFGVTARGNQAYLIGWGQADWARDMTIEGAGWTTVDSTLYIVELNVDVELPPSNQLVELPTEYFTWFTVEKDGLMEPSMDRMQLFGGEGVIFRFYPLQELALDEVVEMTITLDRQSGFSQAVPLELWNWEDEAWESWRMQTFDTQDIEDPMRFIGEHGAIEMRVAYPEDGPAERVLVERIRIHQRGFYR